MSASTQSLLPNGTAGRQSQEAANMDKLNDQLANLPYDTTFHGDTLIGDPRKPQGLFANLSNSLDDVRRILTLKNAPAIGRVAGKLLTGGGLDVRNGAQLVASMSNDSNRRAALIESQVKTKYERMLHPPLTYLGDAFQYRTADGKFNSVLIPHLGQGGTPYAKTVPSITHPLGALPDPGDIFDRLMARQEGGRTSKSGLSSMLIYHATIIIHDIFRTNDKDKNISDSSSYLDLSPLYGYTEEMVREVRDDKYKLGLLKPDTFAEDRLLRQPPGVCTMLVMYNRYHNYVATQLRRINENGRFSVPAKFRGKKLTAVARKFVVLKPGEQESFDEAVKVYEKAWKENRANEKEKYTAAAFDKAAQLEKEYQDSLRDKKETKLAQEDVTKQEEEWQATVLKAAEGPRPEFKQKAVDAAAKEHEDVKSRFEKAKQALQAFIDRSDKKSEIADFEAAYDAAWKKLDDDLFNTARLITCGQYVQVSVHDYLRALMGFHQFDTNFTLDPRKAYNDHKEVTRGLGNQVTVEFNVLYRFHCAISMKDERHTERFIKESFRKATDPDWDPKKLPLKDYMDALEYFSRDKNKPKPWRQEFGLKTPLKHFKRHPVTGLFDDQQLINTLIRSMDDPISNFGPLNIPRSLRNIEIMGLVQARKWEVGTLNDFRDFFGMSRHDTFESISPNKTIQNALRDLYEHPDKVELYPGVFCESDADMGDDPGPTGIDSSLWSAIFSDAITLVRSDRFYTVDWNTNSLTSWGMKEVTSDNDICKSSVFHRLIQRAFPEWFPYDSIRFFHPFYTAQTNAKFARAQGYANEFRMDVFSYRDLMGQSTYSFDTDASNPNRPVKPLYLATYDEIEALLLDTSDTIVHPARLQCRNLPAKVADVLTPGKNTKERSRPETIKGDDGQLMKYFADLTQQIVLREFVNMTLPKGEPNYQIDVVRDFAIPVTVRWVADFLGFGSKIRTLDNLGAQYSENEIYQHITNCQTFLSYNVDETKMLKRRKAFQASVAFLYNLTKEGHVLEASRASPVNAALSALRFVVRMGRKTPTNAMAELGLQVARQILDHERDFGRAAAVLLLIAIDSAYISVLAFTSVINKLIAELYDQPKDSAPSSTWSKIQALLFPDKANSADEAKQVDTILRNIVLNVQKESVKLPIVRKAISDREVAVPGQASLTVKKGQVVVCDLFAAGEAAKAEANAKAKAAGAKPKQPNVPKTPPAADDDRFLPYRSFFTEKFAHFQPKSIAEVSLTAMVKTLAQMKNLRRGHTAQGRLKKVRIDQSYEGYANFMAPGRMDEIAAKVQAVEAGKPLLVAKERIDEKTKQPVVEEDGDPVYDVVVAPIQATKDNLKGVFNKRILKPSFDTYLTPEWDEMVPFPNTWKVRFDGFGKSTHGGRLEAPPVFDDSPPFYQPTGPSSGGGAFADTICHCADNKSQGPSAAELAPSRSCGCGGPGY